MSTLGNRLRSEREKLKLNQSEFAKLAGVTKQSQINYESDRRHPDSKYLAAIAKAGIDITFLISGDRTNFPSLADVASSAEELLNNVVGQDFEAVPRYDVFLAAGDGALNGHDTPVEHLAFAKSWLDKMNILPDMAALLSVKGESMQPTLFDGDLVLVDRNKHTIQNGKIYAFVDGDRGARVKRLRIFGGTAIVVQSDNHDFDDEERTGEDMSSISESIIGEVIWSGHTWV
jgi:phage repressor protein C with HTH and peptisase S24 domain